MFARNKMISSLFLLALFLFFIFLMPNYNSNCSTEVWLVVFYGISTLNQFIYIYIYIYYKDILSIWFYQDPFKFSDNWQEYYFIEIVPCLNEGLLPTYTHTHTHTHIYVCVCVCVICKCIVCDLHIWISQLSFVCIQLNGFIYCCVILTIQFNISHLFLQIENT